MSGSTATHDEHTGIASASSIPGETPQVDTDLGTLGLAPRAKASRVLSRVIMAGLVTLVLLLVFVPWQQSVSGGGKVIAYAPEDRVQYIEAPLEGRIVSWNVTEGVKVRKGDVLCEMTDNDPLIMTRIQTEIDLQKQRIAASRARAESIDSRVRELESARKNGISRRQSPTICVK